MLFKFTNPLFLFCYSFLSYSDRQGVTGNCVAANRFFKFLQEQTHE